MFCGSRTVGLIGIRHHDRISQPIYYAEKAAERTDEMNIAYTEKYQAWRAEYDPLFTQENRCPQFDEISKFADGFSVRTKAYCCEGMQRLTGSDNELLNGQGQVQYTWRNLDIGGEFCSLFRHRNGNHYLVFRTELYGYSVYEVESGKELHYVPSQVHQKEEQTLEEVFIWTSADYDPRSDLLAVTGCMWAYPYSTIILNFSEPLQEQPVEQWLDVREILDPEYTIYLDFEFARWENNALILRSDKEEAQKEEIYLSVKSIKNALNKLNNKKLIV